MTVAQCTPTNAFPFRTKSTIAFFWSVVIPMSPLAIIISPSNWFR